MKPEIQFCQRMSSLFGEPDSTNPEGVIHEYVNALRGQTAGNLDRAADIIARERRIRAWPTVAECLDAVALAKKLAKSSGIALEEIEDFDGWWAERMARIRIAKTERELQDQITIVEPYAASGMILRKRLAEVRDAADERRKQWNVTSASELAKRKTGEAA